MTLNPEKPFAQKMTVSRALIMRLLSAAVMIPLVMGAVYLGGRLFAALMAFACIVMIFEWTRMVERRALSASFYVLSVGGTAAMFAASSAIFDLAFGLCALSGIVAFFLGRRSGGSGFWPGLAAAYVLIPTVALLWLRLDAEYGRALTYILFFIVWAADTGAFVTGKLIGGPKINHALSPSKTWAGIGGGVIGGSVVGAVAAHMFFGPGAVWAYLLLGGVLGAASVAGDLAESAVKRKFGVKDISSFIPGHGGALDRMDGMIFATATLTTAYFIYIQLG